jgi:hypothetical protein
MGRTTTIEAVPLADDRAQHALRDLLDAARRTNEHLSYGALALPSSEREQLRALLADVKQRAERAIDATAQRQVARLRGRRGWRYGRDRGARIQTPWGEQLSRRWHGALLEWAIELDDAARARDRARVLGLILGRIANAHTEARERQQAAEDARAELLELCAAAANVPGISLALLADQLGIARQTLHESLTRLQHDGPLNPPPRWHELTHTNQDVRHPDDTLC